MRENKSSHACSQRELSEEKGVSPSDKNGYFTKRSSLVVIMEHRQRNLFGLRDPDLTLSSEQQRTLQLSNYISSVWKSLLTRAQGQRKEEATNGVTENFLSMLLLFPWRLISIRNPLHGRA